MFRFYLDNDITGKVNIRAPKNWDAINITLLRNKTYKSIFRTFALNVEFVDDGAELLLDYINNHNGLNGECKFIVDEYDPTTFEFKNIITSDINFDSYKPVSTNNNTVNLSVSDSFFMQRIKQRDTIKVPLIAGNTLDGELMPATVWRGIHFPPAGYVKKEDPFSGQLVNYVYHFDFTNEPNLSRALAGTTDDNGFNANPIGIIHHNQQPEYSNYYNINYAAGETIDIQVEYTLQTVHYPLTVTSKLMLCHDDETNTDVQLGGSITQITDINTPFSDNFSCQFTVDTNAKVNKLLLYFDVEVVGGTWEDMELIDGHINVSSIPYNKATRAIGIELNDMIHRIIAYISNDAYQPTTSIIPYGEYHALNGRLIRGMTVTDANMAVSFKDVIVDLHKLFNAAIVIDDDTKTYSIVDINEVFIDSGYIYLTANDVEYDTFRLNIDKDNVFNSVLAGAKSVAHNDDEHIYNMVDFMYKGEWNNNVKFTDNKFNLIPNATIDVGNIEKTRHNQYVANNEKISGTDNTLYIINTVEYYLDPNIVTPVTTEDFTIITPPIVDSKGMYNLNFTPARLIDRHYEELTVDILATDLLKFSNAELITKLSTRKDGESYDITECVDIDFNGKHPSRFRGIIAKFEAKISDAHLDKVKDHPYNLITVYNPIDKRDVQGWVKEFRYSPVTKFATIELILKNYTLPPSVINT